MIEHYKAQVAELKAKAEKAKKSEVHYEVARLNFEIKNYEAEIARLESK